MGRFVNPAPQYIDTDGKPLSGGKLYFYITGTTTPKDTFSDAALSVANANPVILNDSGTAPNIYLSDDVLYKLVIHRANDSLVETRNNVGEVPAVIQFADYSATVTYGSQDIVEASNGFYYISNSASNLDNTPQLSGAVWSQMSFDIFWNVDRTYGTNDIVRYNNETWHSINSSHTGNTPIQGSAFWDLQDIAGRQEGAWTPVLGDGTNTATSATATGYYVRVGNTVWITCTLITSSLTGSGTVAGAIQVNGLPFAAAATYTSAIAGGKGQGFTTTAGMSVDGEIAPGAEVMLINIWDIVSGTTQMSATQWTADGGAVFTGTYLAV